MISVIVPIYKVEPYLAKCVDSILAQTHTNLEIILVDDGSPDRCGAICDEYAATDNRIKVIHQENLGLSGARNTGLAASTGEYIAFVDSDDWIEPEMMEKLRTELIARNADIAECGYRWIKPDQIVDKGASGTIEIYSGREALDKLYYGEQLYAGLSIVVWNKLFRAETIKGIRFPQGLNNEDCLYTPKAYFAAEKVVKLNENLYNFNIRPNSITRSDYNLKKMDSTKIQPLVMAFFKEKGLENLFFLAQEKYFYELYHHYYECRKRKRNADFHKAMRNLQQQIKEQHAPMLANPLFRRNALRIKLFSVSPTAWFAVMWAGKTAKHYKGRIQRWIRKHKGAGKRGSV